MQIQKFKPPVQTGSDLQLFAWVQLKRKQQFTLKEVVQALGMTSRQAVKLLSRLNKMGLILRLTKGVYLAPEKLPPGGKWGPDRLWVLSRLMAFYQAEYQVTGPEAFHRYGLSDQI